MAKTKAVEKRIKQVVRPKRGLKKARTPGDVISPRMIKVIERRRKVILLRAQGWDYEAIAHAIESTVRTVRSDVIECLGIAATELLLTSENERELQKIRLDMLLKTHLTLATDNHVEERIDKNTGTKILISVPPDPAYASIALKVMERQAKLMALDSPEVKKLEVSGIREYLGIDMDKV